MVPYEFKEDTYCLLRGTSFRKLHDNNSYTYLDPYYQTMQLRALYSGGPEFTTRERLF